MKTMLGFFILFSTSFSFADRTEFPVTAPGKHAIQLQDAVYGSTYHPDPTRTQTGCSYSCDMFGCKPEPGGMNCSDIPGSTYPQYSHDVIGDIEVEILPPPMGMELNDKVQVSLISDSISASLSGSQKFASEVLVEYLEKKWRKDELLLKGRVTIKPLSFEGMNDAVQIVNSPKIQNGILSFVTGTGASIGHGISFVAWKRFSSSYERTEAWETEVTPHTVSTPVKEGILHEIDLAKVLGKSLEKGNYFFDIKVVARSKNAKAILFVDNQQRNFETNKRYKVKIK